MRLFLAINLDPGIRRSIVHATATLRDAAPDLRWVDDSRLHLTLKFLGEQGPDAVESLHEAAVEAAGRQRPFTMRVRHVGAFPNFRRARVVWLGVEQDARLELLHHDVEIACEARGFAVEGRPFRPHVTLARVPHGTSESALRRAFRAARRVDFEAESAVESVDVMQSTSAADGPRYERLFAAPLRHEPDGAR